MGHKNVSCSLMHYLCTYPTIQGRGCATKMLQLVFYQNEMMNKRIYAVTKLPQGHFISYNGLDIRSEEFKEAELGKRILELPHNDASGFFDRFKFTNKKINIMTLLMSAMIWFILDRKQSYQM